jgi:aminocarboxymuconate-semialdehyde decarboxylase
MTVIDVHTHMFTRSWLELLQQHGGKYNIKKNKAGLEAVFHDDAQIMALYPQMWDYDLRIKDMDAAKVDVAIVSLTSPNCYWGGREVSLKAAKLVNDSMAEQSRARPGRIRWFASLPWQYADDAKAELARSVQNGAVGVMVLANIAGRQLTEADFAPVWKEIDRLGLPVLVHPSTPPGYADLQLNEYGLVPSCGFMFDTTLAFQRMILDGFIDTYPGVKLIATHGGATLPYLSGRMDRCHEMIPAAREKVKEKPSTYLQRIWYDTVVYDARALDLCIAVAGSDERVLYGSDYPHNIGDMPGCLARVRERPAGQVAKIAGKNAEKLFKL